MRQALPVLLALGLTVLGAVAAATSSGCGGSSGPSGFSPGGPDGSTDGSLSDGMRGLDSGFHLGDTGSDAGCTNLECQQTCAATSVSGKVYDPAGVNGLYNVYVYVPNAPLDPIPSGPVCTACQAPASGDPITSTTTASDGTFTLTNVPSGTDIPIILQLGKWRRHLTLPTVGKCATITPPDGFFKLPSKQHEGSIDDNIPLIAFTTGCDGAECFFAGRIGIDQSEFDSPGGTGRVQIFKSANDDGQTFPGITPGSADTLWGSTPNLMMQYDIVFDACECSPYDRGGAGSTDVGYKNFLAYLNAGGRAFTTHYFYNFYANEAECDGTTASEDALGGQDCYGQGALPTVGEWEGNCTGIEDPTCDMTAPATTDPNCPKDSTLSEITGGPGSCLSIDTGNPKGVAFAQWYKSYNSTLTYGGGEAYGYAGLTDIREDMGSLEASLVTAGTATPWLYSGSLTGVYDAYYFSMNTPIGTNPMTQCGRAIYSDVHVSGSGGATAGAETVPGSAFPSYCATNPNTSDHAPNELALEFLFFDLSSCVQSDKTPPVNPPPK
jgi:hypothetical protein